MSRFVLVVCPRCRNPFIIEPGPRMVSCRNCNKRLEAAKLRVIFASDSFKEAQAARASMVARLSGDGAVPGEAIAERDVMERIGDDKGEERFAGDKRRVNEIMEEEARRTRKKGQQAILVEAFDELSENGEVNIEEYWAKVSFHGIDRLKFDQWVDKMIETGVAYSPRYGFLRKAG